MAALRCKRCDGVEDLLVLREQLSGRYVCRVKVNHGSLCLYFSVGLQYKYMEVKDDANEKKSQWFSNSLDDRDVSESDSGVEGGVLNR